MFRGTTPTHKFKLPDSYKDVTFSSIFVTYEQHGEALVEKTGSEVIVEDGIISVTLTQEETLKFREDTYEKVKIQIRAKTSDGVAMASNIFCVSAGEILKEGEI